MENVVPTTGVQAFQTGVRLVTKLIYRFIHAKATDKVLQLVIFFFEKI